MVTIISFFIHLLARLLTTRVYVWVVRPNPARLHIVGWYFILKKRTKIVCLPWWRGEAVIVSANGTEDRGFEYTDMRRQAERF
jgi:hypothetical protein